MGKGVYRHISFYCEKCGAIICAMSVIDKADMLKEKLYNGKNAERIIEKTEKTEKTHGASKRVIKQKKKK